MIRFRIFLASLVVWASARSAVAAPTDWLIDPSPFKAKVEVSRDGKQIELSNGLLRRVIRLQPNAATVALDNLVTGESLLRGVKPEALVEVDGRPFEIGGLKGQPNYAFLRPEWIAQLQPDPAAFRFVGYAIGKPVERMAWKQVRHHAPGVKWPPAGVTLRLDFEEPAPTNGTAAGPKLLISVHYELYDGLPCYGKWITVSNRTDHTVRVDRFSSEVLAVVERTSEVDELSEGRMPPNFHIETDMAFGGSNATAANRRSYRWLADPDFRTQVNYERKTPCLLDIGPDLGPGQDIAPGGVFESFHAWVMPFDSSDRERCGLAMRRMYRVIAPWATENPLMLHLVTSEGRAVTNAIDQCAAVGFEMLILSFGSGFDLENRDPAVMARAKSFAAYAHRRGIEIGSYSLLASRSISKEDDVVMPPGEKVTFGNSPCLESRWGTNYFNRLYEFHRESGFTLLEHDGSYPGDPCASELHPGHHGQADSRWNQWREISGFYKWCRGQGLYLNVPDHYFLAGSTKSGMGYREENWSLPREQQVIHTRQNIYDGTWEKLPSMGWMFVPLTQYQGGGAAATIEPLEEHLDHYRRMLEGNLALGVQACYRGPRLYDTDRTKAMVQAEVSWFKAHREILESELIHGRRADARDLDWMLHVNPHGKEKGMLVVFNPLAEAVTKKLRVNLYYTGLTDTARIREQDGATKRLKLDRDYSVEVPVQVPAGGMSWFVLE
ncbi:MAG TPA: alpha-galactosidase [Candidatus Limnocylindria bacterium]|nr:alpha-galactosidase [Candidatus Limnocylindria bacterium]